MADSNGQYLRSMQLHFGLLQVLPITAYMGEPNSAAFLKNRPLSGEILFEADMVNPGAGAGASFSWYGPFAPVEGSVVSLNVPEGEYTVALLTEENSDADLRAVKVTVSPCFDLLARPKAGKVQLVWSPLPGALQYNIYRSTEADPRNFVKVGETTSLYLTFLDSPLPNESTYLYIVGAVMELSECFSAVSAAHPTRSRLLLNYPPIIHSAPILQGFEGVTYNYDVNAVDPNLDPLEYHLLNGPAGMTIHPLSGLISWTPVPGLYDVAIVVLDGRGGVATQEYQLTVESGNTAPLADAGLDQVVPVGQSVMLDGSASSDPDSDPLTYSWTLISGPVGTTATLVNPTTVNPTFEPDLPGDYVAQLTVNDGFLESAPDTVTITAGNSAPVSNAGPDQSVFTGQTVTLDGSGSSDVDGNPLTYQWSIISAPIGSAAALSSASAVQPIFTPDLFGTYVVQLVVNDGLLNSLPDTITITTGNSAPAANAGANQTTLVGQTVTLDGSASTDVDGNPLTFSWSLISVPAGSAAALSNPSSIQTSFVADEPGTYIAQLIVNDGLVNSTPDTVTITTENSKPVAHAGADQITFVGLTVTLDGSGSSDVDGHPLTYLWSLINVPAGSSAALSNPSAVQPTFVADSPGTYVAQLIVNDGFVNSDPDTVTISTGNSKPIANAGADQTTLVGQSVSLDGTASSDVDGNPVTYFWSFISVPAGSTAVLSDASSAQPTFVADRTGTYVAQLIVNDGLVDSDPDTVTITTDNSRPLAHAGADQVTLVGQTVTLDGSGSTDVDGDAITFSWSLTTVPVGSTTSLSDPSAIHPTFVADRPGTYVAQLIVNDGRIDSTPDTVTISTGNSKPVANAGLDQTVLVGQTANLDGTSSSDADGNALTYFWSVLSVPAGSSAALSDPFASAPDFVADIPGTYVFQLIVNDGQVDSEPDTVTISTSNSKPVANAGPDQNAVADDTVTLDGTESTDADFNPLTYLWAILSQPAGSTAALSDASAAQPTFIPDLAGEYLVQLIVHDGTEASAPDTVTITVAARQVTVPNVVGMIETQAEAALIAAELIKGAVTTAHHESIPAGQVISQNPTSGSLANVGSAVSFVISLGPEMITVPNVIGLQETAAQSALLAAQLSIGAITLQTHPTIPAGQVISQNPTGGATVPQGTAVALVVSSGTGEPVLTSISVSPPNLTLASGENHQYTATGTFSDGTSQDLTATVQWESSAIAVANVTSGGLALALEAGNTTLSAAQNGITGTAALNVTEPVLESILVTPVSQTILVGQQLNYTANGVYSDGTSQNLTTQVLWGSSDPTRANITSAGVATGAADGTTTISATVGAIQGTTPLTVRPVISEAVAPTATITSPANNSTITSPTPVIGTANDVNFLKYVLELAPVGESTFTTIAEGTSPVINGTLGTFDPTLLLNDLYTVRLTVFDRAGNGTIATATYQAARDQKVGIFTLAFQDLNVPVAGLPIVINRVYDSRDKGKGDFGIGWRLDIQTMKVRANRVQGTGWQVTRSSGFFPTYTLVPTTEHKVSITLPDGKIEEFDLSFSPSSQQLLPLEFSSAVYTPRTGTLGKLAPLDGTDIWIIDGQPGIVTLYYFAEVEIFDPQVFQYTAADGQVYVISKQSGVQSVTDLNSNTLTINNNGITHSSGKSVTFTRDAQGRITRITDPSGNFQTYSYNNNGDLVTHVDPLNNTTRFLYNLNHGLIEIRDPRGIRGVKNEYDENGRITAHIDADGNRIEYTRDIPGRQEIVTDRLGRPTLFTYDTEGNVLSKTDALGHTTSYTYDARGNRLSETNPLGNKTESTYDARDNVLTEKDPLGNVTAFTYNARNQVLTITDPAGRITSNTYDARGNLLTTTDPSGAVTTHAYDGQGNVLSTRDALNQITTFEYDSAGNLIKETNPLGHVTTYTYDSRGNRLTETKTRTDENGIQVPVISTFIYDAKNRVIQTIDPLGHSSFVEYDSAGKQSATIDKLGRRTEYTYDARGNLLETNYPDGTSETLSYDLEGNLISSTDRGGRTTQLVYDNANRLIKTIFPDGAFTQTEYDPAGRQTAVIDERSNKTSYEYDQAGRNIKVIDALGNISTYVYNSLGQRTEFTDALTHTTLYSYDTVGRQTRVTWPNGFHIDTEYDLLGRKKSVTDEAGQMTRYEYDALGRLVKVIDPLGGTTEYAYEELGSRTLQRDANGRETRFTFDSLRQMVKRTLPLGMSEQMTYDAVGNLISKTDFNGQTTTYTYDSNQRLVTEDLPGLELITFTYSPSGQRLTTTALRGVTTYTYDNRDRLNTVQDPRGYLITYTYDAHGNRTSVTVPSGTTTFTHDDLNRLATVTDPSGGITAYAYDAVGNRSSVTYPNGTKVIYSYDVANRLISLVNETSSGATISSYSYTLGARGSRTQVVEHSGRTVNYTYDVLARLTTEEIIDADLGDQTIAYTYDAVANRLSKTDPSGVTTYTYDANDRLLSEGGNTYTYDANGNTLSKTEPGGPVTLYTYDAKNRLETSNAGGKSIFYEYDEDGIRTATDVDGVITEFIVDKNRDYAQVLEERTEAGALIVSYIHGDDLISQTRTSETSYYLYDGHGTTRALTDATETVRDRYTFEAFGILLGSVGTTVNSYLYAGEQLDANTGFYYLRARYYNPENGHFLSMDPFPGDPFSPRSLHKYLYANANPINHTDPSGQFSLASLAVTIAISAVLNAAIGAFHGETTLAAIGENLLIGALEGVAFYALGGIAIKAFIRFGNFLRISRLNASIAKVLSKVRPVAGSSTVPGTGLPTQFIFRTAGGDVLVSSGTQGSAATGALKHIVNDILRKKGAGSASHTQLAEILALEELEGAITLATLQGVRQGEKIVVQTAYASWELLFEWSATHGVWKLFHAVPKIL